MKGFVTVDTPEDYQKWLAEQAASQAAEQPAAARSPRRRPAGTAGRRPGAGKGGFLSTVAKPLEVVHHAGVHAAPTSFWRKYIFSLDHKVIGIQYLFYALFMLVIGGLLATLVR